MSDASQRGAALRFLHSGGFDTLGCHYLLAIGADRNFPIGVPDVAPRHRSSQREQVSPQAIGAGTRKRPFDLGMGASPDRHRAREQRAARTRQLQPATAPVVGIDHDRHEAAPLQRLERGGQRRAIHGKQRRDRTDAGGLGPVQRHHQRVLAAGQAERPERLVEAPRERPRRALQVQAQARVADEARDLEGNLACL